MINLVVKNHQSCFKLDDDADVDDYDGMTVDDIFLSVAN